MEGGLCSTGPWIWDFAGGLLGQRAWTPVHLRPLVGLIHHLIPLPGQKGEEEILGLNLTLGSLPDKQGLVSPWAPEGPLRGCTMPCGERGAQRRLETGSGPG